MEGQGSWLIYDYRTWEAWHFVAWTLVILTGMHILTVLIPALFEGRTGKIEVRGKHLDVLEPIDQACILFNKLMTAVFVYHCIHVTCRLDTVEWRFDREHLTLLNTLGSLLAFYVVYDFFYTLFHRLLHVRSLYGFVHKHHHKQKAPTRGNLDAINVHPFEFVCGEYLHLLTIYLVPCHVVTAVVFVLAGGIFASLNHTRFDVVIPGVYTVKNHDVHHRLPESNYGQYIMLWDHIFGSYRPYTEKSSEKSAPKQNASSRKAEKAQ